MVFTRPLASLENFNHLYQRFTIKKISKIFKKCPCETLDPEVNYDAQQEELEIKIKTRKMWLRLVGKKSVSKIIKSDGKL